MITLSRPFLLLAGLATFLSQSSTVLSGARGSWDNVPAIQKLLDGVTPTTGKITLELPGVTQDGSAVSLSVRVDHPLSGADALKEIHVFADGNPSPELLSLRVSPLLGEARFSTRIRLERSQNVIALARTADDQWLVGEQAVRVTVSGCLTRGQANDEGPDFMQTRVRPPAPLRRGQTGEIRTLITHPMETGLRTNRGGQPIPERIIHTFTAELEGETVVEATLHRAISMNPFLLFPIAPESSGELNMQWIDTSGRTATAQTPVVVR